MKVDQKTGLVEMIMDKLEDKDEGTYTFQLQDGKATNQSSLVLIGDGKTIQIRCFEMFRENLTLWCRGLPDLPGTVAPFQ